MFFNPPHVPFINLAIFAHSSFLENDKLIPDICDNLEMAGLARCRKSCRLRWINYLRPDLKRGNFSADEDELIIKLHDLLGNRYN